MDKLRRSFVLWYKQTRLRGLSVPKNERQTWFGIQVDWLPASYLLCAVAAMKKSVALELTQIDQGIETLLSNAEDLVSEAKTLFFANASARALSLAHPAREEFSKAGMLQAAVLMLLAEQSVDWTKLMYRLRDHKAKLYQEHFETSLFS